MRLDLTAIADFMLQAPGGMTQADLSRASGLSAPYVSQLLSGSKPGGIHAWHKIADSLGVHLSSIVVKDEPAEVAS